jgi:cytochrome c biogenesis protein CcmG, thiol:disulfide interchange protein DsbE
MKGTTGSNRMARSRALCTCLVAVAVPFSVAALAVGGCSGGGEGASPHPAYGAALRGAPPALAALYREGDRLLAGGIAAYRSRLRSVRGHPVVVNDWASWCEPCRRELPLFGRAAARVGKRVAFLGVDAADDPAAARTFLRERPLPYPSFDDPDQKIAASQGPVLGYPRTAFYDARGKLVHVKQGPYTSEAELAADIRRYAGPGRAGAG